MPRDAAMLAGDPNQLADAMRLAERLLDAPRRPVFWYTDAKAVTRRIKEVSKRAGIAIRTSPSAGRHSFGTNAIEGGAKVKDVMDAGGWKSAALFMKTYVHTSEAARKVAGIFDKATGPVDTSLAQGIKGRRSRFGKH